MIELFEAVQSRDLLALIQVYAEGVELMEPLPEVGPVSLVCLRKGHMSESNLEPLQRGHSLRTDSLPTGLPRRPFSLIPDIF